MDQITHEMRLKNWEHVVEECNRRPEGVTVKQWLSDNGINVKVYYYWLRRVRQAAYDQLKLSQNSELSVVPNSKVSYAEITLSGNMGTRSLNTSVAVMSIGNVSIDISEHATEEFLVKLMRAMKHAG